MRVQTLHKVYVDQLETMYGWERPSPAPFTTRPKKSQNCYFVDIEQQARQLDRVFEWLGQPPMLPRFQAPEDRQQ